jgi:hypothetical protein
MRIFNAKPTGGKMDGEKSKQDRASIMAAAQIIFGIVIFSGAWWIPDDSRDAGFYIFGFITVLLGIATAVMLSSRR